jgi:hypothetical protein
LEQPLGSASKGDAQIYNLLLVSKKLSVEDCDALIASRLALCVDAGNC